MMTHDIEAFHERKGTKFIVRVESARSMKYHLIPSKQIHATKFLNKYQFICKLRRNVTASMQSHNLTFLLQL